jgi:MoaA/NifB/PqqE/SkfB family radical SAM enzyme
MGITIFSRYFILLLRGQISFKQYIIFVKRIFLLSKVLSYNKAVYINNVYKIHLYLPGFPSKAFYKAIDKFLILSEETIPTTVLFSMTKACGYKCSHCYQKNDGGEDLPIDKLIKVAQDIQNVGVSMFDIEGGEPLLKFDRLLKLIQGLDNRNEIWINTTGYPLTYEKALKLKQANLFGVMVSIHHWLSQEHDKFVGKRGAFAIAVSAIKTFQRVGINTVLNCCPSFEMINDGGIEKIMKLAKSLNCSFVQFIHEKPAGAWIRRGNTLMDKELLDSLCKKHITFNHKRTLKDYPSVSMQVFEEYSPIAFGCTAGGIERFYVNAHGEVQPCEFLNVSFGNVQNEEFIEIYKRMRKRFKKPTRSWLCNTESASITKYIIDNNITSLPLKKEIAAQFIERFDNSKEVPLYQRMRLCEKI